MVGRICTFVRVVLAKRLSGREGACRPRAEVGPLEGRRLLSTVSVSNGVVDEGGRAAFAATLDAPVNREVRIRYETADMTAVAGRNYVAKRKELVIPAGQTSKTIYVKTKDDDTFAANKKFRLLLSDARGADLAKSFAVGRVINTDAAPAVRFPAYNPKAPRPTGAGDTRELWFKIRVTGRSELPVKVKYATFNGTAIAGSDYVRRNGVLTFDMSSTDRRDERVAVTVMGGKARQPNEVFGMKLVKPQNVTVETPMAAGTIKGDPKLSEGNVVTITPDVSVAGGWPAGFYLRMNQMPATAAVVNYATAGGSAVSGLDFTPASGSVTFRPGETERYVSVATATQAPGGEAKTFTVNVSAAANVAVAAGSSSRTVTVLPTPAQGSTPSGGITGQGISISPSSEWAWVGNYFENLKFNYVLASTRPTPPAGLRMELVLTPRDSDATQPQYAAVRSAPVTGTWEPDGTLRGSIDASQISLPAGAQGLWQIHGRLVDAEGLVYATYGSFLIQA